MAGKFNQEEIRAFASAWKAAVESGMRLKDFSASLGVTVGNVAGRRRRIEKELGIELPSFAATPLVKARQEASRKLALRGWSPEHDMTRTVPDGYAVKGVSTLYNGEGAIAAQWVKSSVDHERQAELLKAACEAMAEDLPKVAPAPSKGVWRRDLLTAYPIGDPHIGMYSWQEESGENWDLDIAERTHCAAMDALVTSSPQSEQAVIINLGDALHYDSMAPVTSRSGNMLDADGRYAKMVRVAIKTIRQCITSALQKHRRVHVVNVIGNHDETGAVWMAAALSHVYEDEPRVTVETSPSVFSYYRFGNTLLGFHHGHTCKPEKLPGVMASDRSRDWGETLHRYWLQGHVHHASFKEFPGVSVESFGTLSAKDAYATNGGWRSRRSMTAIVYDKQHGEIARSMVRPEMFEPEPKKSTVPPIGRVRGSSAPAANSDSYTEAA